MGRAWALMEIAVNHDLVPGGLEVAQPLEEIAIGGRLSAMMVIGHDQERGHAHAAACEVSQHFLARGLRRRGHVVQRNHQRKRFALRGREDGEGSRGSGGHVDVLSFAALPDKRKGRR